MLVEKSEGKEEADDGKDEVNDGIKGVNDETKGVDDVIEEELYEWIDEVDDRRDEVDAVDDDEVDAADDDEVGGKVLKEESKMEVKEDVVLFSFSG